MRLFAVLFATAVVAQPEPPAWETPKMPKMPKGMMAPNCTAVFETWTALLNPCGSSLYGEPPAPETACPGPCMQFMNAVDMWRPQLQWCFNDLAMSQTGDEKITTQNTLRITEGEINTGCAMNEMGDFCATALDMLDMATTDGTPCPTNQSEVDMGIEMAGCCIGSTAELIGSTMALLGEPPCPKFKYGKPCKTPKWKLPKMPPADAPAGGKKKAAIGIGVAAGGLAGLGVVGLAMRRRKQKQQHTQQQEKAPDVAPKGTVVLTV